MKIRKAIRTSVLGAGLSVCLCGCATLVPPGQGVLFKYPPDPPPPGETIQMPPKSPSGYGNTYDGWSQYGNDAGIASGTDVSTIGDDEYVPSGYSSWSEWYDA